MVDQPPSLRSGQDRHRDEDARDDLAFGGDARPVECAPPRRFQTIARRIAQIIEAYAADAKAPRWSNVHLYQGTTDRIAAIDPGLRNSVARRRKDELDLASLANKMLASRFGDTGDSLPALPGDKPKWPPKANAAPKYKSKNGLSAPEGAPKK